MRERSAEHAAFVACTHEIDQHRDEQRLSAACERQEDSL